MTAVPRKHVRCLPRCLPRNVPGRRLTAPRGRGLTSAQRRRIDPSLMSCAYTAATTRRSSPSESPCVSGLRRTFLNTAAIVRSTLTPCACWDIASGRTRSTNSAGASRGAPSLWPSSTSSRSTPRSCSSEESSLRGAATATSSRTACPGTLPGPIPASCKRLTEDSREVGSSHCPFVRGFPEGGLKGRVQEPIRPCVLDNQCCGVEGIGGPCIVSSGPPSPASR